jgi:hypothetical protein
VPTPPGSADVDKRSARAEKVDYKRFSTADGGAYNVVAHATIGGIEITSEPHPIQSNDMTITIAAQQVTPSPANIFKARARVTIRPASAAAPAGSVLKWFCDGPGKPANCDKNVNPAADGSDDFPRDTENRSYTITAKLMPATGTEALATSTTLTVDPVPAATFRITAEDRKTDRDPKTDFIAKVFNGSETAEYTLAAGESIRWAWKDLDNRDQTANGPTLVTDRKARSMSGKVFLLRGEAKLAETNFTIDAKDSCRQRGPAGNCLDREPEEEEEAPPEPIVLPDVAPNGAAPPNFIPITLPPRGGMQIMRGFN